MPTVEVFQYRGYDIQNDKAIRHARFATRAWIEAHKQYVTPVEESRIEIDEDLLDGDGRTVENFDPKALQRPA